MSYRAHSKPSCSPYPRAPPRVTPLHSQYPYNPSDDCLPLYDRRPPTLAHHPSHGSLPTYQDSMKVIDRRCYQVEQPPRYRSSFALSDIFEDEEHDIEIHEIVPSSPHSSLGSSASSVPSSVSLTQKFGNAALKTKILHLFANLRSKYRRVNVRTVENGGTNVGLDLLS